MLNIINLVSECLMGNNLNNYLTTLDLIIWSMNW
nr:MAG TPA: hypothetical protein [Caudoviricetes sp.]